MKTFFIRITFFVFVYSLVYINAFGKEKDTLIKSKLPKQSPVQLDTFLQDFYPLVNHAVYSITVCADLPVNDDPACVFKKGEPGHVFLILKKQLLSGEVVARSFGFYPRVPVSCLVKKVRSKIMENACREYDASLTKILFAEEFHLIIQRAKEEAKNKYNLKKYNCYDYVLAVFNSLPGTEKIPVSYVKFPFIFGRGGSPCSLYADLKKLKITYSSLSAFISFGSFKSPERFESSQSMASFQ